MRPLPWRDLGLWTENRRQRPAYVRVLGLGSPDFLPLLCSDVRNVVKMGNCLLGSKCESWATVLSATGRGHLALVLVGDPRVSAATCEEAKVVT
jgi:hypothetical protein